MAELTPIKAETTSFNNIRILARFCEKIFIRKSDNIRRQQICCGFCMVNMREIKAGDLFWSDFEGKRSIGEVIDTDIGQGKVLMAEGDNEFWYDIVDLFPIPIGDEVLGDLGFIKGDKEGARIEFKRGPFSILKLDSGETWLMYRDEVRHLSKLEYLHELQHHHRAMTNFGLIFKE